MWVGCLECGDGDKPDSPVLETHIPLPHGNGEFCPTCHQASAAAAELLKRFVKTTMPMFSPVVPTWQQASRVFEKAKLEVEASDRYRKFVEFGAPKE